MTAAVSVSTTEVLTWLRRRRGLRRRKLGRFAYIGYVIGILVLFYGIPIASTMQLNLGKAQVRADVGPEVARSLLAALAGLFLVALAVFVRSARWRGPVVLAIAEVTWLLPMPLERRRVLRPRFFIALGMAAVVGAVLGGISGAGVRAVRPATGGAAIALFVVVFAVVGLLGVSLALIVEASPRIERLVQRWSALPLVLGIAFVGIAVLTTANGAMPTWVDDVIAWSGPWGWGAYAISAVDRTGSLSLAVVAGVAALVVVAAAVAVLATRMCADIPSPSLRVRARTAQSVGAAVFMGDARGARLSIRASRAQAGRARGRLPRPRSARLVIVWRDALGVIRAPGQLGWAATFGFSSIGVLTIGVASSTSGKPPVLVVILAVILGYAAATSLVETARLDSDNPQIAGQLPTRYSLLALAHAIVPFGILVSFGVVAWLAACALEPSLGLSGLAGVLLCAPVLIAAALFNSYRGRVPIELLLNIGDAGGFVLAGWYLAAPLVVVALLTPGIVIAFDAATTAAGLGSVLGNLAVGCVSATTIGLWAVSLRAARRVAPPKEGGFFDLAKPKS